MSPKGKVDGTITNWLVRCDRMWMRDEVDDGCSHGRKFSYIIQAQQLQLSLGCVNQKNSHSTK